MSHDLYLQYITWPISLVHYMTYIFRPPHDLYLQHITWPISSAHYMTYIFSTLHDLYFQHITWPIYLQHDPYIQIIDKPCTARESLDPLIIHSIVLDKARISFLDAVLELSGVSTTQDGLEFGLVILLICVTKQYETDVGSFYQ